VEAIDAGSELPRCLASDWRAHR